VSAKLDSCLGRLGKPFIHFFRESEQLLDARALQHTLEMRRDVGEPERFTSNWVASYIRCAHCLLRCDSRMQFIERAAEIRHIGKRTLDQLLSYSAGLAAIDAEHDDARVPVPDRAEHWYNQARPMNDQKYVPHEPSVFKSLLGNIWVEN
jgi:hypothetical protein